MLFKVLKKFKSACEYKTRWVALLHTTQVFIYTWFTEKKSTMENEIRHLGFCLDTNLSGKSMTRKSIPKNNGKLQFLYG